MLRNPETPFTPEVEFDPRSIAVVTTTFYPKWYPGQVQDHDVVDKVRGDLALQTLQTTKERGYNYIVLDASSKAFQEELAGLGIVVGTEREKGMSASRRQGFQEASELSGVKVICWTEPEKVSIVRDCLPDAVKPIIEGRTDIVVPKRVDDSYASYPDYQVAYEQRANKKWNEILRAHGLLPNKAEDLDVWFGPKFFKNDPELLKLFLAKYDFAKDERALHKIVNPELWPNATFLPVVAALHKGYRVASVDVPYVHPLEQTKTEQDSPEFVRKRQIQFRNIIDSTVHFVRHLEEHDDSSKLHKSRLIQV